MAQNPIGIKNKRLKAFPGGGLHQTLTHGTLKRDNSQTGPRPISWVIRGWLNFISPLSPLIFGPFPSTFNPLTFSFQNRPSTTEAINTARLHNAQFVTRLQHFVSTTQGNEGKFMVHAGMFVLNHWWVIAESFAWSLTMRCWSTSWVGNLTQTQEAPCFSPRAGAFAAKLQGLMCRTD